MVRNHSGQAQPLGSPKFQYPLLGSMVRNPGCPLPFPQQFYVSVSSFRIDGSELCILALASESPERVSVSSFRIDGSEPTSVYTPFTASGQFQYPLLGSMVRNLLNSTDLIVDLWFQYPLLGSMVRNVIPDLQALADVRFSILF